MITLKLSGQRIYHLGYIDPVATDSINQVEFEFMRGEEWENLDLTAQFTQGENTLNVHLGDKNTCSLPSEIREGELLVSAFAVNGNVRRNTALPLKIEVKKSGFVGDGETPIPPTPDLYQQIIAEMKKAGKTPVDPTLSKEGEAADAKAVGDKIGGLKSEKTYPDAMEKFYGEFKRKTLSGGQWIDTTSRIGLTTPQIITEPLILSADTGYKFAFHEWGITDSGYVLESDSGWIFESCVIYPAENAAYTFVLSKTDNSNLKVDEAKNFHALKYATVGYAEGLLKGGEPQYVKYEKERVIGELIELSGKDNVMFAFNTDQHITNGGVGENVVIRGLKALSDISDAVPLDFICLGGDAAGYEAADTEINQIFKEIASVNAAVKAKNVPVISMIGNHDGGQNNSSINSYNLFTAHTKREKRGVVKWMNNFSANGYIDDELNRIRYIFFDSHCRNNRPFYRVEERNAILTEMFNNTLNEKPDYSVVVFSHHPLSTSLNQSYFNGGSNCGAIVNDFVTHGGKLIACICGHNHRDAWEVKDGVLFISTAQACHHTSNTSMDDISNIRTLNTRTETAFDVYAVNQSEKTITAVRYGCGVNRKWSYSGDNMGKIDL